jgi:hypothetical protein
MSFNKDDIQEILIQAGIDQKKRSEAMKIADEIEAAKKEEREAGKSPKSKYNYTVLLRVDDPEIKKVIENTEAFITKTAESIDQSQIIERITIGASRQNDSVKKKGKINTFADYFAFIKSKFHKSEDAGAKNVSKQPVRVIVLDSAEIKFS